MSSSLNSAIRIGFTSVLFAGFLSSVSFAEETGPKSTWTNPQYLTATLPVDRFTITGGGVFSSISGRTIESRQALATGNVSDTVMLWYGVQSNVVKGHSSTSRLHASSSTIGARWIYQPELTPGSGSWAVQLEKVTPGVAETVTSGGSQTFNPTKNYSLNVIHTKKTESMAAGYANVKGAVSGNADVFTLTYGQDRQMKADGVFSQAQLIGQRWTGPATSNVIEVKAMLTMCYRKKLAEHLNLDLEGTLFPFGLPMSAGSVTGLSSFLIYEPGGPSDGLRNNVVGFAAARLTWSQKL